MIGTAEISTSAGLQIIDETAKTINSTKAVWKLKGNEGEHVIQYTINGKVCNDCRKNVIITNLPKYAPVVQYIKESGVGIKQIQIDNTPLKVLWKLSWIWLYIIISVVLSLILRKVMKIY